MKPDETHDPVWNRVNRELLSRRKSHTVPGTWAALGQLLGEVPSQVLTNWKARGIPPKEHRAIADALGWSVDYLLGNDEAVGSTPLAPLLVTAEERSWVLAHRASRTGGSALTETERRAAEAQALADSRERVVKQAAQKAARATKRAAKKQQQKTATGQRPVAKKRPSKQARSLSPHRP